MQVKFGANAKVIREQQQTRFEVYKLNKASHPDSLSTQVFIKYKRGTAYFQN
jgi:hypothetical protein